MGNDGPCDARGCVAGSPESEVHLATDARGVISNELDMKPWQRVPRHDSPRVSLMEQGSLYSVWG